MVNVYLSKSSLAISETALINKSSLKGLFFIAEIGNIKIAGKKIPSLWGKNWDEIGGISQLLL